LAQAFIRWPTVLTDFTGQFKGAGRNMAFAVKQAVSDSGKKKSTGFIKNGANKYLLYLSLALTDFLDTCSFTLQIAQVVELGATYPANHHYFNLVYARPMQGEDSFNTHTVGHFTYGEGRTDTIVVTLDANALKNLDALFVTLGDLNVHTQCIPRLELRDIFSHIFHADVINNVHRF